VENNNNKSDKIFKFMRILIVIGIAILLYFLYEYIDDYYYEYIDLKESVANYKQIVVDKNKKIAEYNNKLEKYENQIEFMDNYVAICPTDGKGLYHKYSCTHYNKSDSFYIFNIANTEQNDFSPCQYCYTEKSSWEEYKEQRENSEIVYITNTGSKYHRSNCSYLKSKNSITKEKAIQQGYSACSRCNP